MTIRIYELAAEVGIPAFVLLDAARIWEGILPDHITRRPRWTTSSRLTLRQANEVLAIADRGW